MKIIKVKKGDLIDFKTENDPCIYCVIEGYFSPTHEKGAKFQCEGYPVIKLNLTVVDNGIKGTEYCCYDGEMITYLDGLEKRYHENY